MPKTTKVKSRGGTFAVSPWMSREDHHGTTAQITGLETTEHHRIVESPSLLVSPFLHACDSSIAPSKQGATATSHEKTKPLKKAVDETWVCPYRLNNVECIFCFRCDGGIMGIVDVPEHIEICGKVIDVSNLDCTNDSSSHVVVLCLHGGSNDCRDLIWVLTESSGGDAMCLKSPITTIPHELVSSISLVGSSRDDPISITPMPVRLAFQCHTIVNCEARLSKNEIATHMRNSISNGDVLRRVVEYCVENQVSHVNVGTMLLEGLYSSHQAR